MKSNKLKALKVTLEVVTSVLEPCDTSADEAMFISKYMEQHPDKKLNRFLKKKLRTQYLLRGFKNGNKQHKSSD